MIEYIVTYILKGAGTLNTATKASNDVISIIIPCYNEEQVLPIFFDKVEEIKKRDFENKADFEYIFVDDGSIDSTLSILKSIANSHTYVKYISFSRNFGKEAAILAGLEAASGNFATLMDADLQDSPDMLLPMYDCLKNEDYDKVGLRRTTRKGEPPVRSFCAKLFYKFINSASDVDMVDGARDFALMKRCVVDAILSMKEKCRYTKGIFSYVGFKTKWMEYENIERAAGNSKWSFTKLFKYAVEGIVSFSSFPLTFLTLIGALSGVLGLILTVISLIIHSLILTIIGVGLVIAAACEISSGILGLYISQNSRELRARPVYIIRDKNI